MLKVGDEVIIKNDLILDKSYDGLIFVEEMEKYQGEKTKIKAVLKREQYTLEIDDGEFYWNERMFYPALAENNLERKTFETGAVRDTDETKGRCDLMPLDIIGHIIDPEFCYRENKVLSKIESLKSSMQIGDTSGMKSYLLRTILLFLKEEYKKKNPSDSLINSYIHTMLDLSRHFKTGAEKYGVDNWKKGIPYSSYIDSGVRHYLKHLAGMADERHDIAFLWNMICLAWTVENMPEMNDFKDEEKCLSKGGADELEKTSNR